jgi:DNA-binding transcriptional LysR family regulator
MMNEINLSRTDLNLLVLFEVVLEERHVGRAAQRLNLTASAVSHGLGRLRRLMNDPLFVRTPRGVVPTSRALELAEPVADVLSRARRVIAIGEPFDPARSTRCFRIGAPDGVSAVFLPPLLAGLRPIAPGISISARQTLPAPGDLTPERAWRQIFTDLDERAIDIAVAPIDEAPARFHLRPLYHEDFVVAGRAGHPLASDLTLDRYCAAEHLVVSLTGDPHGFVDELLAREGCTRRIALTVPSFMLALAILAETDLVSAMPRRFVAMYGPRFGISAAEPPLPLTTFRLNAIAPKAAMTDAGLAWLLERLSGQHGSRLDRQPAA